MENQQIAKIFEEIGELLELKGENVFRVRAYHRAAQNIDGLSKDVAALSEEELEAIPGIGKDLAAKIREYAATGKVAKHEALKEEFPAGVLDLLRVPGLGPKTVKMLYQERNITGVDELEALARAGKLAGLPGIQKKTEENILKGIELVRRGSERRPLGRVRPLAEEIVGQIRETGARRSGRGCRQHPAVEGDGERHRYPGDLAAAGKGDGCLRETPARQPGADARADALIDRHR